LGLAECIYKEKEGSERMKNKNVPSEVDSAWYERSFDAQYRLLYAHRTVEAAKREAVFAARLLELRPDDRVLDLCCGNGRHMTHLSKISRNLVGLDYSTALLSDARGLLGGEAALVRGDMRRLPFDGAFDVLTNFFTSFGYFREEAENAEVMVQASRALKSGGRFFIDHINAEYARKTLVPNSERELDGKRVEERRWVDEGARRVNKVTKLWDGDELLGEWGESVRLYEPEEFLEILARGRLMALRMFGDYDGAPRGADKPRMIVTGCKE
jgi:SAM-dependent methyltransferase